MKTASIKSLKIYEAVETFKKTYFNGSADSSISTSSASKKDKNDKGYYNVTFCLDSGENVPDFLEKENFTEEVRLFFEKELSKNIRFVEVAWSYEDKNGTFDMSMDMRF